MREIQSTDVIGRKVTRILAVSKSEGDMDYCDCVLVLDSGLKFRIPGFRDEPFLLAEEPTGAVPLDANQLRGVLGSTIARLLRPNADDDFWPGLVLMGFTSGKWIAHEPAAPSCLGATGIQVFNEKQVKLDDMVDFWER